jgi:hypothetical protein
MSACSPMPTIDQFFSLPANNKYGTKYTISEASDMTPENVNNRDPLDTWLQDDDVSSVMDEYFDALDLDKKWATTVGDAYINSEYVSLSRFHGGTRDTLREFTLVNMTLDEDHLQTLHTTGPLHIILDS